MKHLFQELKIWVMMAIIWAPFSVSAQGLGSGIKSFVDSITSFLNKAVIPLLILIAIIVFFWNLIRFLSKMGNEKEREQFKKYSINALLALFVIFSVWGIVGIFTRMFFQTGPFVPQLPIK